MFTCKLEHIEILLNRKYSFENITLAILEVRLKLLIDLRVPSNCNKEKPGNAKRIGMEKKWQLNR